MDLFQFADQYPKAPGHKGVATSMEAGRIVADSVREYHEKILRMLIFRGVLGSTADEAAEYFGETVLYMRPRFSELRGMGKIVASNMRRKSVSGRSSNVWVLPEFLRLPPTISN